MSAVKSRRQTSRYADRAPHRPQVCNRRPPRFRSSSPGGPSPFCQSNLAHPQRFWFPQKRWVRSMFSTVSISSPTPAAPVASWPCRGLVFPLSTSDSESWVRRRSGRFRRRKPSGRGVVWQCCPLLQFSCLAGGLAGQQGGAVRIARGLRHRLSSSASSAATRPLEERPGGRVSATTPRARFPPWVPASFGTRVWQLRRSGPKGPAAADARHRRRDH